MGMKKAITQEKYDSSTDVLQRQPPLWRPLAGNCAGGRKQPNKIMETKYATNRLRVSG